MHSKKLTIWRFLGDPCLHVLTLVLLLVGYKLFSLEVVSRTYMDCQWCLSTKALTQETELILLLLAIHLLSCVSRLRSIRIALRVVLAYFSPSWTAFQADRGRDFSVIVDGISN